ncbi:hypothetical protein [Methanocaldococcus sp.]
METLSSKKSPQSVPIFSFKIRPQRGWKPSFSLNTHIIPSLLRLKSGPKGDGNEDEYSYLKIPTILLKFKIRPQRGWKLITSLSEISNSCLKSGPKGDGNTFLFIFYFAFTIYNNSKFKIMPQREWKLCYFYILPKWGFIKYRLKSGPKGERQKEALLLKRSNASGYPNRGLPPMGIKSSPKGDGNI